MMTDGPTSQPITAMFGYAHVYGVFRISRLIYPFTVIHFLTNSFESSLAGYTPSEAFASDKNHSTDNREMTLCLSSLIFHGFIRFCLYAAGLTRNITLLAVAPLSHLHRWRNMNSIFSLLFLCRPSTISFPFSRHW